jgi:SEC-C motif domain protein
MLSPTSGAYTAITAASLPSVEMPAADDAGTACDYAVRSKHASRTALPDRAGLRHLTSGNRHDAGYFGFTRARTPAVPPPTCPCENARMDPLTCPCGLGEDYESCCGRLHAGAPAPTAESLMRSRYSAFAVGDTRYLLRTWHPSRRPRTLSLDPALRWTRLAILETRDGGLFDTTGTVQFRAVYVQHGQRGVLAETSKFLRHDRDWTYLAPID